MSHTSYYFTALLLLFSLIANGQSLKVSENQRYLVQEDGTPFFWLGDTAWELFHRLDREEATNYLKNRADKGFTVIQAVVLAEQDGLHDPNPYGHTPLVNDDPAQPNEEYFTHVDFIVDKAEELGLYIGMLPTWGDKFNKRWGIGPEVFTPHNAYAFGKFLSERYRDKPIIWILGGDRIPEEEEDFDIIRQMAKGLNEGDGGAHLTTYHPMGEQNSATFFHDDEWLDFNMFQSGHGKENFPNYQVNLANLQRTPLKPTMDSEPNYEDIPINFKLENGRFDDVDARQAAYWNILSGGLGHTYGNNNIWQMWQPGRKPILKAGTPWHEAMDHPGAFQMGYLRALFESRPFTTLLPDSSVVISDETGIRSARGDGFVMVYLPQNPTVDIDLSQMEGKRFQAWWFDPRSGDSINIGKFKRSAYTLRTPSGTKDWVLVIDDASYDYPPPGDENVVGS
ncbi:MAG: glycoside hydrolase family 140 protein [Bacteroidota bacterium]